MESGQALVEFAFIVPLLVLTLAGIVYIGTMVVTQQTLATSARHVARTAAIDSTGKTLKAGKFTEAGAGVMDAALRDSASGSKGITRRKVSWGTIDSLDRGSGRLESIGQNAAALTRTGSIQIAGKSYKVGIGVYYHGVTLQDDYRGLAGLGTFIGAAAPKITATSVMPQELPPRGPKNTGILDMNTWIQNILNEPVK